MIQTNNDANSKTYFQPKDQNLKESESESNLTPFSNQDKGQKLLEDQMNSISDYWSKEGLKEEDQNNNSHEIKTQKISNIKQEEKKKKDNPWPDA